MSSSLQAAQGDRAGALLPKAAPPSAASLPPSHSGRKEIGFER